MARQGLQGRPPRRRRRGLTRPDKAAAVVADLLRRDFTAEGPDQKWVGDFKQVNTVEGPVCLATVEDLFSRRMLGFAQSDAYPTAQLATAAQPRSETKVPLAPRPIPHVAQVSAGGRQGVNWFRSGQRITRTTLTLSADG